MVLISNGHRKEGVARTNQAVIQHMKITEEARVNKFLFMHGLIVHAEIMGDIVCPPCCDGNHQHGDHYRVSLMRDETRVIEYDHWDTLYNKQMGHRLTNYDVMLSINVAVKVPDNVLELVHKLGPVYLPRAVKIIRHRNKLRKFLTQEELQELSDILSDEST